MSQILNDVLNAETVPGISMRMIRCTPKLAEAILTMNRHNRKLRDGVVAKYCHEILDGAWLPTAQGIGIDGSGNLIDGQHRLTAIIKTGVTVPLLIVWGLPSASQAKSDRHAKRTMFDSLNLKGKCASIFAVQVATFLAKYTHQWNVPSDSQIEAALDTHESAINFVCSRVPFRKRGVCRIGAIAAVVIGYELNNALAISFLDKLMEPTELRNDDPRYKTHQFLMAPTVSLSGGGRQVRDFKMTAFGINAWFAQKPITKLLEADDVVLPPPEASS